MSNITFKPVIIDSITSDASYNSDKFQIRSLNLYLQLKITETVATYAGTVKLQGSVDPDDLGWQDITDAEYEFSGTSGHAFNISNATYPFFRVVVTRASGTGTIRAIGVQKDNA